MGTLRTILGQTCLPEGDLFRALQRLDLRLARALAAIDGGDSPVPDDLRGLCLAEEDIARSLARSPGEPPWAYDEYAFEGGEFAWLRATLAAGGFGVPVDAFDAELVLIALAPEIDLRYERVYAFLQDDVTRRLPTVELALGLLCPSFEARLAGRARLAADAPLVRAGILRLVADPGLVAPPLLARYLKVDEQLTGFLLAQPGLDARLARYAVLSTKDRSVIGPGLPAELIRASERAAGAGPPLCLYFRGQAGADGAEGALTLATALGLDLLTVDLAGRLGEGPADADLDDVPELVRLALRDARFRRALPCLTGFDALGADPRSRLLDAVLAQVAAQDGLVVLSGSAPWPHRPTGPAGVVAVDVAAGCFADRRRRWTGAMAAHDVRTASDTEADVLAARFRLSGRQIDNAVAVAARTASTRGRAPGLTDLMAAARAQTGHHLAAVATWVPARANWDDLVLPADVLAQLRELCDRIAVRERVLGDWRLGDRLPPGQGVAALFTGPPGTGKTTAAAIVAGRLGLDLYRIDLSRVVSKYIGDTEKNLDRVFTAAADASAVLLFDEADALFGKRSAVHDAHDRYANVEVAYLLQKMEEHEGITILATNLQDNLDDAFARRLAFTIGFPFPDTECRQRIWAGLWPASAPLAADVDLELLARELILAGGSVRNIGVAAAFLAAASAAPDDREGGGVITMAHVLHAARRECAKLGRVFPERLADRVR